jgi:hypothetical protein
MKPMTSEEQRAALGSINRKSRQGDLFTGEFAATRPKKGNGRHIRLTRGEGEPVKAIGMAHFPGTGPERTYCRECKYCQDIDVYRGGSYRKPTHPFGADNVLPIRTERDACMKAAKLFDDIVQRGRIGSNRSCRYFEGKDAPRATIIGGGQHDAPPNEGAYVDPIRIGPAWLDSPPSLACPDEEGV